MNDCDCHMPVSDAERVKGLLDGTVDPSELEDDSELYSLAERIYGRDALDEMGIAPPVVPTANIEEMDYTNGNNLEVELPEEPDNSEIPHSTAKKSRPKFRLIAGLLGLMIVGLNIVVGVGAIVDLCENPPTDLPVEFNSVANMQDDSSGSSRLYVTWTITNMDPLNSYTVEWTISEDGSNIVVDSDTFSWTAQNTYIHSEDAKIVQEPWCYISTLFENGTQIAISNSCQEEVVMQAMTQVETTSGDCEDNPKLLWTELSEYENPNSWAAAGSSDILDGALLMLFGMIAISGLRRISTS